jgi:AhpD family alkylhydroperoxidase
MSKDIMLTTQEKEIIALGVSVAAGCQPCTLHHLEAARAAGVCSRGTTLAINVGAAVRRAAADAMAGWAIDQHGTIAELTEEWVAQRGVVRALASVAAAFAVNSVGEFDRLVNEARTSGATDRQIEIAIGIARNIKSVAAEKIEAAAQKAIREPEGHVIEANGLAAGFGCAAQPKRQKTCGCSTRPVG